MKLLRTATVAAAAAFVVLAPTAAHADTATRYDSVGDVVGITFDEETEEETITPAPDRKQGDISKVRTSFEGEVLRVSTSFRALVKAGPFMFHSLRIVTSKTERSVDVFAGPGGWAGESALSTKFGSPVKCAGLAHKLDYTNKIVIISVPRTCLAVSGVKPGAVQVGFGTGTFGAEDTMFIDDGFKTGPVTEDVPLTLSAKIFR